MSDTIELTERQRKRLESIKEECTGGGHVPKPSDGDMLDSLMDTWDAVGEGHYTEEIVAVIEDARDDLGRAIAFADPYSPEDVKASKSALRDAEKTLRPYDHRISESNTNGVDSDE